MARFAFIDAVTGALKSHGFCKTNELNDLVINVADDFFLEPGKWKWDGKQWIAYIAPLTSDQADVISAGADTAIRALRNMTPIEARSWVNSNINSLADAKILLGTLAAVVCILARRL